MVQLPWVADTSGHQMDILSEKNGFSACSKFYITEPNKRKFSNVIFFSKVCNFCFGRSISFTGRQKA